MGTSHAEGMRWALVALLAAALAAPGLASAASRIERDRGVVQTVSDAEIVLRALDGTLVPLAIGPATKVKLNGRPSQLASLRPGFIAEVVHRGPSPAVLVRAFGVVRRVAVRGVVAALAPESIEILTAPGPVVSVPLSPRTRFLRAGRAVRPVAAELGARVVVVREEDGPALLVRVLGPPRR